MNNTTEITPKLNALYEEYRKKDNNLNDRKTNEVVLLLARMTRDPNSNTMEVAEQLSRFSYKICQIYFDELTRAAKPEISVIDDLIKDFLTTAYNSKQSYHFVRKFANTIVPIIKNYGNKAINSKTLPSLVAFIAGYALNSEQAKEEFRNIINKIDGAIYLLDYSDISKKSLNDIWKVTSDIFPDLSKARYKSSITEWAVKYGFITSAASEEPTSTDNKVKTEESVAAKGMPPKEAPAAVQSPVKTENVDSTPKKEEPKAPITNTAASEKEEKPTAMPESAKADTPAEKPAASSDEKVSNNNSEAAVSEKPPASKSSAQILYERLKRDMDKEQKAIITAFTDMITPVGKAFESIQGEINKSRKIGIENTALKAKNEESERQIAEMKTRLQENSQALSSAKAENSDLRQQVASLENKIAELDGKLNDAYSINSRESSLEAEKVRSELKKAFSFLYEDWLEYEFSDVSEDNYQSLQAIIKKIFRSLERNGIDFKGND